VEYFNVTLVLMAYTNGNKLCGNSFFQNLGKEENKGMVC
jgi:hypothetical protein